MSTGDRVSLEPGTPSGRTFLAVCERHSSRTETSSGGLGDSVDDGVCPSFPFDRRLRPAGRHPSQHPTLSKARFPFRLARDGQRLYQQHRHGTPRGDAVRDRFRYQDQASGRPRPLSRRPSPPNRPLLRRSASVGDIRRCSQLATARSGRVAMQAPYSERRPSSITLACSRRDFTEEVIGLQQQRHQQRERDRLEATRRQEMEHAKAKAVACQLACRVLCRGHRTRILVTALWRWRSQAAGLKIEQDRRDEQRREHEQVRFACMMGISATGFHAVKRQCVGRVSFDNP